jgi:hypothetical protein
MRAILLIIISTSVLISAEVFKDLSTGLIWEDSYATQGIKKDLSEAKVYCKELKLDGKSDWRLPNIKELYSIVDTNKFNPSIKNGFKNIVSYYYWSSTPFVSSSSDTWYMDFSHGSIYSSNKSHKYYVRCVRARQ